MNQPELTVTEIGLLDYIRCPLLYAFRWYYRVLPPELPQWEILRGALRTTLATAYSGESMEQLDARVAPLGPTAAPMVRLLLADLPEVGASTSYDIPAGVRVGPTVFIGTADCVSIHEDGVHILHVSPNSMDYCLGLAQAGFPASSLPKFGEANVQWYSVFMDAGVLKRRQRPISKGIISGLAGVSRSILSLGFYPRPGRWCESCAYRRACNPRWCLVDSLRAPDRSAKQIEEMLNEGSKSVDVQPS